MKTLTIIATGLGGPAPDELLAMEKHDEYPRISLFAKTLESELLNERFLRQVPGFRGRIYRHLPALLAQMLEAYHLRHRYDVIITWAERLGYPFALLLKLTGSKTPHITLNSWISKPKKARMLRFVEPQIDRIILWSSVQRDFALRELKISPSKIVLINWLVDQEFWRPIERETGMICSAGSEMRDYLTLIEAMRGLDIPCHIAAGATRGKLFSTVKVLMDHGSIPANVTIGLKSYPELRDLYARSRFVVVPLLPNDADHGTTTMLEAMAMGKAVICSQTEGQVDVVRDGYNGIYVPPGDPPALRSAIERLWDQPELARRMGTNARKYILEHHTLERFANAVREVALDVIREKERIGT
ncbi:MAG: glycosyltransferase family 4 protein [Ignavibacteria bacterium]|nr:MAG: glycosyltransferase family 4 protein [Ignavibacteria bacterium]